MTIKWTVAFEMDFDLDEAYEDFKTYREDFPEESIEDAINYVVRHYINYEMRDYDDKVTDPVYEIARKALEQAIGGEQLEMDLPL